MKKLNFRKREEQRRLYHKLEQKNKFHYLKRFSEADSIRILSELHKFAYKTRIKPDFDELDAQKIRTLSKVHSIFNKVKA